MSAASARHNGGMRGAVLLPVAVARAVAAMLLLAGVVGCGGRPAPSTIPRYVPDKKYEEVGVASWYGKQYHGRKTASGETFKMNGLTAAHRTLPLGITAKVTNLDNGRSVKVRINDRGPFVEGRILDVSYGAAKKLDMVRAGLARVRIEIKP